jgi:hypothetical protein
MIHRRGLHAHVAGGAETTIRLMNNLELGYSSAMAPVRSVDPSSMMTAS